MIKLVLEALVVTVATFLFIRELIAVVDTIKIVKRVDKNSIR